MTDEILIRMGLDARPMHTALRGITGTVRQWGANIRSSMSRAFDNLAAPLSMAGIVATLSKVLGNVERIQASADSLGVSTDFVQDLNNIAEAAGLSSDKIQQMLGKWASALPAGANVEAEFNRLADKIAAIPEGADRAKAAIDAFGKSGIQMLAIVNNGSAGLKELASEFSKFSEIEIRDLNEAGDQIDLFNNRLTVWTGKSIAWIGYMARIWGQSMSDTKYWAPGGTDLVFQDLDISEKEDAFKKKREQKLAQTKIARQKETDSARTALAKYDVHLEDLSLKSSDAAGKVDILNKRIAEQQALVKKEADPAKQIEHYTKIADLENDLAEVRAKASKDELEAIKKKDEAVEKLADKLEKERETLLAIDRQLDSAANALINLEDAKGNRSKSTLSELADTNIDRWTTGDMRSQIFTARRVRWLEQRGKWLAQHGYEDDSQKVFGNADKLRSGLTALTQDERTPFLELEKTSKQQAASLDELLLRAKVDGIVVVPAS